jgi:hypothetical protein
MERNEMTSHTMFRQVALTIFLAFGSVFWLTKWHQYGYTSSPITFPPVSTWWRDALILLLPVTLAVWLGSLLIQRLAERSARRFSPFEQTILAAFIISGLTTAAVLLVENSRIVWTGIGNELSFLANICGSLYPNGNLLLDFFQSAFPISQATRLHVLLQDGMNLVIFNWGISLLVVLVLGGVRNSIAQHEQTGREQRLPVSE